MAFKAYNKMKQNCFKLTLRDFVEVFTDTVVARLMVSSHSVMRATSGSTNTNKI